VVYRHAFSFHVRRSGDSDTTKGGHADPIPVNEQLVPFLAHAIDVSPSELVFPHVCGSSCRRGECPGPGGIMRPDVALEGVLRRAMARAGIVQGFTHRCRRKDCSHREEASDQGLRRCPVHGDALWPKPNVRQLRFHDLRHSAVSLVLQSGGSMVTAQRLARHRDP